MAVHEKNVLLTGKNTAGDKTLLYPITKLDCVDGADDLLHYGQAQELTTAEKTQARENIGAQAAGDYAPASAIPTKVSQLTNDAGYKTTDTTYSAATTSKAGLMSASDKSKLNGVEAGANNYTHPTHTAKSSGLYKVTVDDEGHVTGTAAVTKSDITALGIPGQDTNTTYSAMTGATSSAAGTSGLVPAPDAGNQGKFLKGDGTWATPTNTTYSNATQSARGLMSAADKTKLDGIDTGANAYTHPAHTAKESGLYKVTVDAQGHVTAATAVAKSDITALGIPSSNTTYSAATQSAQGLMSAEDKTKLDGIATGANKTTVDSALSSSSTNPVQNKVVQAALAGKSDSGHTHSDYVNQNAFSNVKVGDTTIAADSATDTLTLVAGTNVTITPDATNDKVTIAAKDTTYSAATTSAAGLMSAEDKSKLDGIASGANAYTHPTHTAKSSGLYKVTVDEKGHVTAATAVAKSDITALGIPSTNTTYSAATTSAAGLMSAADKSKLDGMEEITSITNAQIDAIFG